MNKKTSKISERVWKGYLIFLAIFTVLYLVKIKFMVFHMNILIWDMITGVVYIFYKWVAQLGKGKEGVAATICLLVGLLWVFYMLGGILFEGSFAQYVEGTEPQTHRTFVVEYRHNMMGYGKAELYERFGPVIVPCGEEEYVGYIMREEGFERVYIDESGEYKFVSFFFLEQIFYVPL